MPGEPNKPEGEEEQDGSARPVADRQAIRNQGEVAPDDYPDRDVADASGDDG